MLANVERHFRNQILIEDLVAKRDNARTLAFALPSTVDQSVFDRYENAAQLIQKAIEELKSIPTLTDLQTALSLSIVAVKEKRRCAEIGGGAVLRFPGRDLTE